MHFVDCARYCYKKSNQKYNRLTCNKKNKLIRYREYQSIKFKLGNKKDLGTHLILQYVERNLSIQTVVMTTLHSCCFTTHANVHTCKNKID